MKNFSNFINESKEKPLFQEYDIKEYFYACLNKWTENLRYFNLLSMNNYQMIQACKQCEIILTIIEKFADDIHLHFYSAESEEDRKKYHSYYSSEDSIVRVFKIVEQLANIDFNDGKELKSPIEDQVDVKKEISELKSRFEELVKKCNDSWHKQYEDDMERAEYAVGCPVPCSCDCECCKCGY